ncbi:MAG: 4-hydroxy-tetrahydrodipicolinate reductase [Oscillospiraceae bacterium]|nr:4-hydroxy-tetrahydrodipicolinate reductase [Oscillospiraceae bacterium]
MRVIVNGACGRMGREIVRLVNSGFEDSVLAAAVDKFGSGDIFTSIEDVTADADVIVDFSNPSALPGLLCYAQEKRIPLVIATTGYSEEELAEIRKASANIPVFLSFNMSLGIALLVRMAKQAASVFKNADVEIVEIHHNRKLDAPSGTALMLAEAVKEVRPDAEFVYGRSGSHRREKNEIGIHSLRMGNITGEHDVIISTDTQTITLKHEVHDRSLLAEGALSAAAFLTGRPAGMYSMEDILKD